MLLADVYSALLLLYWISLCKIIDILIKSQQIPVNISLSYNHLKEQNSYLFFRLISRVITI